MRVLTVCFCCFFVAFLHLKLVCKHQLEFALNNRSNFSALLDHLFDVRRVNERRVLSSFRVASMGARAC